MIRERLDNTVTGLQRFVEQLLKLPSKLPVVAQAAVTKHVDQRSILWRDSFVTLCKRPVERTAVVYDSIDDFCCLGSQSCSRIKC